MCPHVSFVVEFVTSQSFEARRLALHGAITVHRREQRLTALGGDFGVRWIVQSRFGLAALQDSASRLAGTGDTCSERADGLPYRTASAEAVRTA
jgi:hypothetical protein